MIKFILVPSYFRSNYSIPKLLRSSVRSIHNCLLHNSSIYFFYRTLKIATSSTMKANLQIQKEKNFILRNTLLLCKHVQTSLVRFVAKGIAKKLEHRG